MIPATSSSRVHIVLVPGFGGFDALGQIEYYSGVTPLFHAWQDGAGAQRPRVVLHYFDVLPTASVATRAAGLRAYLAKRFARGELVEGDSVALVGHSTGGLDIRRLILDLDEHPEPIIVDGPDGKNYMVEPHAILSMVRRLVFLSVPQWGTNIADWVRCYGYERKAVVAQLRSSVMAAQISIFDKVEAWLAANAAKLAQADVFLAVRDALTEIDPTRASDATGVAAALEASAELTLWLRYIAYDFGAIDDLASEPSVGTKSPAHRTESERQEEAEIWRRFEIATRSFATIGQRPFAFTEGASAPRWDLLKPWTYPDVVGQTSAAMHMDFVYRYAYRACAGGPFTIPGNGAAQATWFGSSTRHPIEVWDNDGIVNTASMLWPNAEETSLVEGDHGDIIGHFQPLPATPPSPRKCHTYDLLRSASGFDASRMEAIWNDVFDFCAGV